MTGQKLINRPQARNALYVDFEGRGVQGESPVLLGVLFEPKPGGGQKDLVVRQFLLDERLAPVAEASSAKIEVRTVKEAVRWLLDRSDEARRRVVSWSTHDQQVLKALAGGRPFRYRNAIPVAKRWLASSEIEERPPENSLRWFEERIGYRRPYERFRVGESIDYIRTRRTPTQGAIERWETIVAHNEHDLRATRRVVLHALGLGNEAD